MKTKPSTILFIGDSLIEGDRRRNGLPLGDGYVQRFAALYLEAGLNPPARFFNLGIGGNTSLDLLRRWRESLESTRPDLLVLGVGINDLHSFLTKAGEEKISATLYGRVLDRLLRDAREILPQVRVLLIEPFFLRRKGCCDDGEHLRLVFLPAYRRILGSVARRRGAEIFRAHRFFQRQLRQGVSPQLLGPNDPVHLGPEGCRLLAQALYSYFTENQLAPAAPYPVRETRQTTKAA